MCVDALAGVSKPTFGVTFQPNEVIAGRNKRCDCSTISEDSIAARFRHAAILELFVVSRFLPELRGVVS